MGSGHVKTLPSPCFSSTTESGVREMTLAGYPSSAKSLRAQLRPAGNEVLNVMSGALSYGSEGLKIRPSFSLVSLLSIHGVTKGRRKEGGGRKVEKHLLKEPVSIESEDLEDLPGNFRKVGLGE